MPTYKNMNELTKAIELKMVAFLENAGEEIKEKVVKKYIQESFYNQYEPSYYDRTYQLLESVACSKVNKVGNGQYQVEIYLDTDGVNYFDYNHNKVDPQDVFEIASQGWHGWVTQTEGRFMEDVKADLQSGTTYDIFADFKKYLGQNGIITIK